MSTKSVSLFDLAPGKVFHDRYKIVRAFRQGGMSSTFEVEDQRTKSTREMQVFPAALLAGAEQAAEFAQSMEKWKDVRSRAVLAVQDVHVLDDGTLVFVTDMPVGVSLRDWQTNHGPAAPALAIQVGIELLDGLGAIHAAGLVHGDIKPTTVFLDEKHRKHVALVDGGITPALWSAKHLGDKTALIGTPFYAPVEQFGGDSPDVQSDVYNLATVLFEMLTGVIPWPGKSFLEVFQAKLAKSPPSMKARAPKVEVPLELEKAIVGGLMADKKERYRTAEHFRSALAAVKGV